MKNLEAKFRLLDHAEAEARAAALGYVRRARLNQRDTFFRVASGKLKLREENGSAVLIFYRRRESASLMLSDYEIVPVADPARWLRILEDALGEIEAVIADGDDPERSRGAVDEILAALGVAPPDLIDVSYFELLAKP